MIEVSSCQNRPPSPSAWDQLPPWEPTDLMKYVELIAYRLQILRSRRSIIAELLLEVRQRRDVAGRGHPAATR